MKSDVFGFFSLRQTGVSVGMFMEGCVCVLGNGDEMHNTVFCLHPYLCCIEQCFANVNGVRHIPRMRRNLTAHHNTRKLSQKSISSLLK